MRTVSTWIRGLVGSLALVGVAGAQGVYPPPDTFPDLRLEVAGAVNAIARYHDGTDTYYLIGGDFDLVNGFPRRNLARLNADGTLDPDWVADTDGAVNALAIFPGQDDLFVGGAFTTFDGATRNRLAKVDADDGVVDAGWNPSANNTVNALQTDGTSVWAAGLFTAIDGNARRMVARIAAGDGSLPAFNANFTGSAAFSLLLDGNDLYVGGAGKVKSGGNQRALMKVAADTGGAIAWNPAIGPQGGSRIRALASDGTNVYAVGRIRRIGNDSSYRNGAAFAKANAAVQGWKPLADGEILALALDGANAYVAGDFLNLSGHARLAQVSAATGAANAGWNADADRSVAALLVDGGQVIAGGRFAQIEATAGQGGLVRLSGTDGAIDATFMGDAAGPGTVSAYVFDAAGGVILGGAFDAARQDGEVTLYPRQNIVRLVPAGGLQQAYELDRTWAVNVFGEVDTLALDGNDLFVGGNFSAVQGTARTRLAKLTADTGTVDATWVPTADAPVRRFALDAANGRLYVAGDFLTLAGTARAGLGRLDSTGAGAIDAAWNPNPDDVVDAVLPSGAAVYLGGNFTNVGAAARVGLARVDDATGAADAGFVFDLDAAGAVHALAENADGLYVGGSFSLLGSEGRNGAARIAGGAVDAWNPDAGAGDVRAFGLDTANGHVYLGGLFTTMGGQAHANLARVASSGAGAVDAGWRPGTDGAVLQMSVPVDGEVLAAGAFSLVTNEMRNGIAKLGMQGSDATALSIESIAPVGGNDGENSVFGQGYTVSWSVANLTDPGTVPTGTVTVTASSGESCGPVDVADGACTLSPTATGARSITAAFTGDALFLDAQDSGSHTVDAATLALTVATAPNPSALNDGADAQITLQVQAPGAGTPDGTVSVTVDGNTGCDIVLPATSCTLPAFTAYGFYDIAATYTDAATPALFAAAPANAQHAVGTLTSVDLTLPASALVGDTVSATLATTNVPDGETVTLTGGSGCVATITANAGQCDLTFAATGTATVTAAYAGNGERLPSQDSADILIDPPNPTTTTLDVQLAPGAFVVTGQTVTVSLATNLPNGTVLTVAGAPGCTTLAVGSTCDTAYASIGPKTVTASFAGNGSFTAASDGADVTVNAANTTFAAFAAQALIGVPGDSIAFTWDVDAVAPGAGTPTGNVRVSVNGDGSAPACIAAVEAGTCTVVFPASGSFAMRADYSGDANFNASISATAETVQIQEAAPTDTDLMLSKVVSRSRLDLANQIEQVEFMIVVGNAGPATAVGAMMADVLPAGLANASWTCAPDDAGASCTASGTGNVDVTATLPPGTTVTVLVVADVTPDAPNQIANTAMVSTAVGGNDPSLANNTATAYYQPCPDNAGATLSEHFCTFADGFEGTP